jgi:hypothetical protein
MRQIAARRLLTAAPGVHKDIRKDMTVRYATELKQVLNWALEPAKTPLPA